MNLPKLRAVRRVAFVASTLAVAAACSTFGEEDTVTPPGGDGGVSNDSGADDAVSPDASITEAGKPSPCMGTLLLESGFDALPLPIESWVEEDPQSVLEIDSAFKTTGSGAAKAGPLGTTKGFARLRGRHSLAAPQERGFCLSLDVAMQYTIPDAGVSPGPDGGVDGYTEVLLVDVFPGTATTGPRGYIGLGVNKAGTFLHFIGPVVGQDHFFSFDLGKERRFHRWTFVIDKLTMKAFVDGSAAPLTTAPFGMGIVGHVSLTAGVAATAGVVRPDVTSWIDDLSATLLP